MQDDANTQAVVLPKFEDLSAEEVNRLIAEHFIPEMISKIIVNKAYMPKHLSDEDVVKMLQEQRPIIVDDARAITRIDMRFNPFGSLDDCWKAEKKMYEDAMLRRKYTLLLLDEFDTGNQIIIATECERLLHATPQQKCHAMLLAKGLVQ